MSERSTRAKWMNSLVSVALAVIFAAINRGGGWFPAYGFPLLCLGLAVVMSPLGDGQPVSHAEAKRMAAEQSRAVIYHRPG